MHSYANIVILIVFTFASLYVLREQYAECKMPVSEFTYREMEDVLPDKLYKVSMTDECIDGTKNCT